MKEEPRRRESGHIKGITHFPEEEDNGIARDEPTVTKQKTLNGKEFMEYEKKKKDKKFWICKYCGKKCYIGKSHVCRLKGEKIQERARGIK